MIFLGDCIEEIAKRRIASVEAPPITLSHFEEATDGG